SGGSAQIVSVSGNSVTLSKALAPTSCPSSKPNLEMRRNAAGLAEYVGTVQGRSGATYNLSFSAVSRGRVAPKVGESVYLYCANGDSAGDGIIGGIGDAFSDVFGGEGGIPSWAIIGGIGLAVYLLFFRKPAVAAAK
ncbi:hypothetical protein L0244_21220, partial [bacterium]|nr:hypothetical protein [bacterium]